MVPYYHRDERSLPFVFRVCPENFPILIDKTTEQYYLLLIQTL